MRLEQMPDGKWQLDEPRRFDDFGRPLVLPISGWTAQDFTQLIREVTAPALPKAKDEAKEVG